jgi:hypothetical protein
MLYQPIPTTGILSRHLDLGKARLAQMIEHESDAVYAYVMSTVILEKGQLRQTGTGPNFQGGYITLCTCKHRMRTSLPRKGWPSKWIAGFTGLDCGRHHWLFYLAKVKEAHESQSELWHSGSLPEETLEAKSARYSELGDLYEPKSELGPLSRYDPNSYHTPVSGHSHDVVRNGDLLWRIDIDYRRKKPKVKAKRQPSLLIGDPEFSFLWRKPVLYVNGKWRQTIYEGLVDFLDDLNEDRRSHHEEAGRSPARRCGCGVRRYPRAVV